MVLGTKQTAQTPHATAFVRRRSDFVRLFVLCKYALRTMFSEDKLTEKQLCKKNAIESSPHVCL